MSTQLDRLELELEQQQLEPHNRMELERQRQRQLEPRMELEPRRSIVVALEFARSQLEPRSPNAMELGLWPQLELSRLESLVAALIRPESHTLVVVAVVAAAVKVKHASHILVAQVFVWVLIVLTIVEI